MVLITQTSSNEESQSRQLRVSKKLSKAISSIPRSRFQKPRPNLPGSKRTDPSVSAAQHKSSEKSENNDIEKAKILCTKETLSIDAEKKETKIKDISKKDDVQKNSVNLISDAKEIPENGDALKNSDIIIVDEKSQNGDTFNKPSISDITVQDAATVFGNVNTNESSQNSPVKINENVNNEVAAQDDDNLTSNTLNTVTLPNLVEDTPDVNCAEKNDTPPTTIVNNSAVTSSDRSSKYPHLTSILSKKRAEPKKEVQHKKRKKFKKGDTAPERSKMTMADLIYWNPVNPDPPSKNAAPEDEIPSTSNYDEPEKCNADSPVEESSVCDSVPKLVIAEDGSINIDQSSLVVSRNIPEPTITEVVRKDDTTYSSFRKRPMTRQWTAKDTTVFYKALSLVGTDFGLMEKIFPHRSRRELKQKFKREEKFNIDLINRAMYESHLTFDADTLEDLIEQLNDSTYDRSVEKGSLEDENEAQPSSKEKKKSGNRKRKTKAKATDDDRDCTTETISEEEKKKSTSRKRKTKAKTIDDDCDYTTESVSEEGKKKPTSKKRKTKAKATDGCDYATESVSEEVTATNVDKTKVKRKRKAKKLPEDFLDVEEIDDLTETEIIVKINSSGASSELNSTEVIDEENPSKEIEALSQSETSVSNSGTNNMCETTNIEILCIEDITRDNLHSCLEGSKTIIVPENATGVSEVIAVADDGKISQTISLVSDNEQCVTLEYVEDINQGIESSPVHDVMAYEVVSSNTATVSIRRRKMNFTPKIPNKDKNSCQTLQVSSTNYTPL